MLNWAVTFFTLAITTGVLGFGGLAGSLTWSAKVLFGAFVILTIIFAFLARKPKK